LAPRDPATIGVSRKFSLGSDNYWLRENI